MVGRGDCPPWCAEHGEGRRGGPHVVVVGDVRLSLIGGAGAYRVTYAVRRRAARTPLEMAQLAENLSAAGALLRGEHRQARALRSAPPPTAAELLPA